MPVLTPRLGLSKPVIDGDDDVWGDFLNDNADILDAQVMRPADVAALYLPLAGGSMTGSLLLKANAAVPLEAVTLQQLSAGLAGYLPLTGGTLSGALTLRTAMPAANYEATPKLYVDNGLAAKIGDAPADNQYWVRRNNAWALSPGGMLDAPSDGYSYMRVNGAWSSGGTLAGQLNVTTTLAVNSSAGQLASLVLNRPVGNLASQIIGRVNGSSRWGVFLGEGSAETGGNTGTHFTIARYNDSGIMMDTPLVIYRDTGVVKITTGQLDVGASGVGNVGLRQGDGTHSGYLETLRPDGSRSMYIGFSQVGDWINMSAENGGPGWSMLGNVQTTGYLVAASYITANGARIISSGYNNQPCVAAYNTTGYAVGMWCEGNGNLSFGWTDGNGNPVETRLYMDRAVGDFHTIGSVYSGSMVSGGYIQSTGSIMNFDGRYFVANNTNYWIGRNSSDGRWLIIDNANTLMSVDTNGVMIASSSVHAVGGQMGMFNGGSGRVMQMSPSWYWDWNISTGTLIWYNPNRGPQWINRSDGWCYNDWSAVGGHGPFIDFSDERSKADIQPATAGLDAVLRLNPIRFKRIRRIKDTMVTDDREDIGFSAQQLRDVIPEAVMEAGFSLPDGTGGMDDAEPSLGMATTPIVAALVNAVRELTTRIEELEQTS